MEYILVQPPELPKKQDQLTMTDDAYTDAHWGNAAHVDRMGRAEPLCVVHSGCLPASFRTNMDHIPETLEMAI